MGEQKARVVNENTGRVWDQTRWWERVGAYFDHGEGLEVRSAGDVDASDEMDSCDALWWLIEMRG